MESITDKLQETVKVEEVKNSKDTNFKELAQLLDEMSKIGLDKKSDYSLPLVDTIGRAYYSSLNKHRPVK
jgi:hypothetical protein